MAWNMQIRAERSWNTTSEDQAGLSGTSSTPSEYAELNQYLEQHVDMVTNSLAALTIKDTTKPMNHRRPLEMVLCQQNLIWDYNSDVEKWVFEIESSQASPAPITPASEKSSIRKPLSINVHFTNVKWQRTNEEYTPSVYSKNSSAISPGYPHRLGPLTIELPPTPTNFISMDTLLDLASNLQDVCTELRATVNRAEDSAEFEDSSDHDSDSDVSTLDLNVSGPPSDASRRDCPPRTFYELARDRGLNIASDLSSSYSGSYQSRTASEISYARLRSLYGNNKPSHSRFSNSTTSTENDGRYQIDIDARRRRSNAPSPSSSSSSRPSPIRIHRNRISSDILNRIAKLAGSIQPRSSFHREVMATDVKERKSGE